MNQDSRSFVFYLKHQLTIISFVINVTSLSRKKKKKIKAFYHCHLFIQRSLLQSCVELFPELELEL